MTQSAQPGEIASLNGIRAIAALIVFMAHAGLDHIVPGGFGVTLFFFLSGFLITTLMLREHARDGSINIRNFYLRRIYRILPPMYLVLIGVAAFCLITGRRIHWDALAAQFLQLTNYYEIFLGEPRLLPYTGIMWSLSVEEHFYLLYPLIIVLTIGRFQTRTIGHALLLFCGLVLVWRLTLSDGSEARTTYIQFATDTRIDSIAFGCILGLWMGPESSRVLISQNERVWMILLGAALITLLASFLLRSPTFRETWRFSIQGLALFAIFYPAVRYPHWWTFRWLQSRLLGWIGSISYTFYLIHFIAIGVVSHFVDNRLAVALIALACTLAGAQLMYALVEEPMARLRKRLH